jgi:hypothetical protein
MTRRGVRSRRAFQLRGRLVAASAILLRRGGAGEASAFEPGDDWGVGHPQTPRSISARMSATFQAVMRRPNFTAAG